MVRQTSHRSAVLYFSDIVSFVFYFDIKIVTCFFSSKKWRHWAIV